MNFGTIYGDNITITSPPWGTGSVTSVAAGNGLNFTTITTTGSVILGTPSTITGSTSNSVTTTSSVIVGASFLDGQLYGSNIHKGIEVMSFPMTRSYGINVKLSF